MLHLVANLSIVKNQDFLQSRTVHSKEPYQFQNLLPEKKMRKMHICIMYNKTNLMSDGQDFEYIPERHF